MRSASSINQLSTVACHGSGYSFNPENVSGLHWQHARRLKCYSCHQGEPRLTDWPLEWIGGQVGTGVEDGPISWDPANSPLRAAPNPFNPQTTLTYEVRQAGPVLLAVYDVRGQRVEMILDRQHREVGVYETVLRPDAPSGVYFVRMISREGLASLKVVIAK